MSESATLDPYTDRSNSRQIYGLFLVQINRPALAEQRVFYERPH